MLQKFCVKIFHFLFSLSSTSNFIVICFLSWFVNENYALKGVTSNRIIGGRHARLGKFPYMVSIGEKDGWHFCGGCIIDQLNIITAAHCFPQKSEDDPLAPEELRVIVGAINVIKPEKSAQILDVHAIIINPKYDADLKRNDIAMVRLKNGVKYGKYVQPIQIGTKRPAPGTQCAIAGWGVTKSGNTAGNPLLMATRVTVYEFDRCFKPELGDLDRHTQVCAGELKGGRDSCQGDSGGPLVCEGKTYGIISFGHECGLEGFPAIYTDITKFTEFIKKGRAWNGTASDPLLRVLIAKETKSTGFAMTPKIEWLLLLWIAFIMLSAIRKIENETA